MADTHRPCRRPSCRRWRPTARCGSGYLVPRACTPTARSSRATEPVSGTGPRASDLRVVRKRCTIGTTLTRWHTPFKPTLGGRQRRRWTRGGMTPQQALDRARHIVLQIGLAPDVAVEITLAEELLKFASELLAQEQQRWIAHDCPARIDRLTMR